MTGTQISRLRKDEALSPLLQLCRICAPVSDVQAPLSLNRKQTECDRDFYEMIVPFCATQEKLIYRIHSRIRIAALQIIVMSLEAHRRSTGFA